MLAQELGEGDFAVADGFTGLVDEEFPGFLFWLGHAIRGEGLHQFLQLGTALLRGGEAGPGRLEEDGDLLMSESFVIDAIKDLQSSLQRALGRIGAWGEERKQLRQVCLTLLDHKVH